MAFPPPALPINRTNATPQQDLHPADHNGVNQAVNDTVAEVIRITGVFQAGLDAQRRRGLEVAIGSYLVGGSAHTALPMTQPGAGADPDGYWYAPGNRPQIPAGMGGLYLLGLQLTTGAVPAGQLNFPTIIPGGVGGEWYGHPTNQPGHILTIIRVLGPGTSIVPYFVTGGAGQANVSGSLSVWRVGGNL